MLCLHSESDIPKSCLSNFKYKDIWKRIPENAKLVHVFYFCRNLLVDSFNHFLISYYAIVMWILSHVHNVYLIFCSAEGRRIRGLLDHKAFELFSFPFSSYSIFSFRMLKCSVIEFFSLFCCFSQGRTVLLYIEIFLLISSIQCATVY